MSKLGFTSQGFPIVARCCAEDNSGIVFDNGGVFVLRCSYALDVTRDENGEDGVELYTTPFLFREEAIAALRDVCGIDRIGE